MRRVRLDKPKYSLLTKRMTGTLAIAQSALSIYWEWGCGKDNELRGSSTVVTIDGPLARESYWSDGYDEILKRFKQACSDVDSTSIILRMSSPGGEVSGLYECCEEMRKLSAKSGKRVVAMADDYAHSAAYALACVADEIYLSRTASVGSVGVLCVVGDCVAMNERIGLNIVVIHAGDRKVDGHPDVPLSDEAIATFQSQVDLFAGMFYDLVAETRDMSSDDVAALEAATFIGNDAMAAGLADGVMSFDQVVAMLADDAQQATAAASGNEEESEAMAAKKTGYTTVAEAGGSDAMSKPAVMPLGNLGGLAAIAGMLGDTSAAGQPPLTATKMRASSDDKDEKDDDSDEEDDDDKKSEKTKDGENEEEVDADDEKEDDEASDDDDGDDDSEDSDDDDDKDEDEEDKKDKKDAAASRTPIAAGSTSADVLKMVREMTGESSPAAQIGSLLGMRDKAASADRAGRKAARMKRDAARSEKATLIKSAVASGKLAPSQKEWAKSCTLGSLKAYLKSAPKALVRKSSTKHGKPVKTQQSADASDAIAKVAAACGMDPKALAAHADELRTKGLLQ